MGLQGQFYCVLYVYGLVPWDVTTSFVPEELIDVPVLGAVNIIQGRN